jgi:hypothetical protein
MTGTALFFCAKEEAVAIVIARMSSDTDLIGKIFIKMNDGRCQRSKLSYYSDNNTDFE